jgi:hypothetical protein
MNKLLESNAVVDSRLRQKVVIEAVGTNLAAPTEVNASIPVSGTVSVSGGVAVNNGTGNQNMPATSTNPYSLGSVPTASIMEGPLHQLWRVANDAQACYAQAIRSKLSFT